MKKILIFLLLGLLLAGCSQSNVDAENKVTFYYPLSAEKYAPESGVVQQQTKEITGAESHELLIRQYFSGTVQPEIQNNIPAGTRLLDFVMVDGNATIVLSDAFLQLTGIDRTIACACIAKTVFGITGCQAVNIQAASATGEDKLDLTLRPNTINLTDDTIIPQEG